MGDGYTWTRGEFEMATDQGKRRTKALLYGPLAVHETRYGDWRVSHAPTGFGIGSEFDCGTVYSAMEFVERIAGLCDWTFSDPATVKGDGMPSKANLRAIWRDVVNEADADLEFPAA